MFTHSVERETIAPASSIATSDHRGWHQGRFGVPYRVSGHGEGERPGWVITMHAAGTAIRHGPARVAPPTKPIVRMNRP